MKLSDKDLLILFQSQTQRAIEILTLTGFPEKYQTENEKLLFITDTVTPFLVKRMLKNIDKMKGE